MMNTHINDLQEQLARVCAERDTLRKALEIHRQFALMYEIMAAEGDPEIYEAVRKSNALTRAALRDS